MHKKLLYDAVASFSLIAYFAVLLLVTNLTGCGGYHYSAPPPLFASESAPQQGSAVLSEVASTPSFCFDGLVRKLERAGCYEVEFDRLQRGYIRYACDAWAGEPETSEPLYSHDFFMILWLPAEGHYAMAAPEYTTHICGDGFAILVSAEKD